MSWSARPVAGTDVGHEGLVSQEDLHFTVPPSGPVHAPAVSSLRTEHTPPPAFLLRGAAAQPSSSWVFRKFRGVGMGPPCVHHLR